MYLYLYSGNMGVAIVSVKNKRATIEDVRVLIGQGLSITTAIKASLERNGFKTVAAFAEKYGINRQAMSNHLTGLVRAPEQTVLALVAELGGTDAEWRDMLWRAGKPAVSA